MRMIQLFQWPLKDILNNLDAVKEARYDTILISPLQPGKNKENSEWWSNYQVYNLSIGNKWGTEQELRELCAAAKEKGIKIAVDVIITHYANTNQFESLNPHPYVEFHIRNNPYFWREHKLIDYNNRWSVINHCNGLPSIRTDNFDYQNLVINFFNRLIDDGVEGIRIDSAKMISLPEEDGNQFFPRVLGSLKKKITVFGEVIFESEQILQMYQKYIYPLVNLSSQVYNIDRNKEITYFENHDFYLDETLKCTHRMSDKEITREYKYLLRDFPNTLYYARPFSEEWKYANL